MGILYLYFALSHIFYLKLYFKRFHLTKYSSIYTPTVHIYLPCKGLDEKLRENLEAIATQDYPVFNVTFVTDSDDDPAVDIINELVKKYSHTRHLIVGHASNCSQKNHNHIKAIEIDLPEAEVLVFADSDGLPHPDWLRNLVMPFSDHKVGVTTGFRDLAATEIHPAAYWQTMTSANMGIFMHAPLPRAVWGGAMAIRRNIFEKLGVKEFWSKTVVDDITLMRLLIKHRIKRVFVPTAVVSSYGTVDTTREFIDWFTRQVMYFKLYVKPLYYLGFFLVYPTVALILSAPILLILSVIFPSLLSIAFISALFSISFMIAQLLIKWSYKNNNDLIFWGPFSLVGFFLIAWIWTKTLFRKKMIWRDIEYSLDKNGYVTAVQRLNEESENLKVINQEV